MVGLKIKTKFEEVYQLPCCLSSSYRMPDLSQEELVLLQVCSHQCFSHRGTEKPG